MSTFSSRLGRLELASCYILCSIEKRKNSQRKKIYWCPTKMLMQRMKFRIRLANWLNNRAMKMAKRGGGYRKHHHHDRTIDVSYVHPDDPGDGLTFDGRLYERSVVYLDDNAQPSYIDPIDDGCEECGSVGQKIHSQLFKSVMKDDSEEKVFSGSLKKWVQYAAFAGVGAFFAALMAAIMVYQYAG